MVNPTVSQVSSSSELGDHGLPNPGELVLARPISADASVYDWMWYAWDEAQLEAERAYEAWSLDGTRDGYAAYRAAQDRADAGQDALARCAAASATPGASVNER
jgi:hypothetical protein